MHWEVNYVVGAGMREEEKERRKEKTYGKNIRDLIPILVDGFQPPRLLCNNYLTVTVHNRTFYLFCSDTHRKLP